VLKEASRAVIELEGESVEQPMSGARTVAVSAKLLRLRIVDLIPVRLRPSQRAISKPRSIDVMWLRRRALADSVQPVDRQIQRSRVRVNVDRAVFRGRSLSQRE
jgi:hypothetical protein